MSAATYRISEQAIKDLNDIWLYTLENWTKEQADRYYLLIFDEIRFIANNYYSGKSFELQRRNYRATKVKSHLIFYRKAENDIVEIIRILHQSMDLKKRLK